MAHYIVSYDLHRQRAYDGIWAKLEAWGAVRLLESLWLVTLNSPVGTVRSELVATVDGDDAVAVIELQPGSAWASTNARDPGVKWLTQNIQNYG
jgi:hypothetical protein